MNDKIYNETLTVIKLINNEIRDSNFHNIEHMLLRVSAILSRDTSIPQEKIIEITLDEVRKILLNKSETYKVMYNTEKYKQLLIFFEIYMKKLLKKYNEMMIKESKQFDRYVEMSTGKMPKKKIYEQENLEMDLNNIQNTISMLNEAIRVYLELYENRTLWALFNDGEAMSFKIKEAELAHVLGVEIKKIISNPRLVDVFKITKKEIDDYNNNKGNAAVSILLKLVEMTSGNLMHYEEDRLKKLIGSNYVYTLGTPEVAYDDNGNESLKYFKINARSKMFINFKPLEELSMAISLPKGFNILRSYRDGEIPTHTILISKNNLSENYKYSSLVANVDEKDNYRKYFQTLLAKSNTELSEWQDSGKVSITTRVLLEGDEGSGRRSYESFFTPAQQYEFIKEVYEDFANYDIENVIEYFKDLGYEIRGKRL